MDLGLLRSTYHPIVPDLLSDVSLVAFEEGESIPCNFPEIASLFPHLITPRLLCGRKKGIERHRALRVGVLFSGGPAPGGHTVIAGLFDGLKHYKNSSLYGFLDGPSGLLEGRFIEITAERLQPYRHQGGFDLLGSSRTKMATQQQLAQALHVCQRLHLDGLVIIGGDDSSTTAAFLAEYFLSHQASTSVLVVPKTIDGDVQNPWVPISFGFDTACKTYSEMIGNIARDALSSRKYYHMIRLMGRSASHITLECALQTQPNLALIGEEGKRLDTIVEEIGNLILKRRIQSKEFGVILLPEGLIEFIPEFRQLIYELGRIEGVKKIEEALTFLSSESSCLFLSLPLEIQYQLLQERDSHGNIPLSLLSTDQLLIDRVEKFLAQKLGNTSSFRAVSHFLGYEGRSAFPSNFDSTYTYALGLISAALLQTGKTGYMVAIPNLKEPAQHWQALAVPLIWLMKLELRQGCMRPVIAKTFVDLKGKMFTHFAQQRILWHLEDHYLFPGPIQFFGDLALTDTKPWLIR